MLQQALKQVVDKQDLTEQQMMDCMHQIMEGEATHAQIGAFLAALRMKGETLEEITGSAKVMRAKAFAVDIGGSYAVDTCGTGGDGAHTFNISTVTAFVAAAAGVTVVKHGNRSVSSQCGSADVLEQLGVDIALDPSLVSACIKQLQIGFVFAPQFHAAMKHVMQPRRELGIRTIFNVLGPLTNPASVQGQVLGVFDGKLTSTLAHVLGQLGVQQAMVVHGLDGLDELTLTTKTQVSELKDGEVATYLLDPRDYGFSLVDKEELVGGTAAENAQIALRILGGEQGPRRDIVLLNAAAAIYVGRKASSIAEGIDRASAMIDEGLALAKLEQLAAWTKGCNAS